MTLQHALLFEAESIQAYITDSGRLSDVLGASARIDQLCGDLDESPGAQDKAKDLLGAVLEVVCGERAKLVRFSRRGGGAFIAFFPDAELRDRVQALWSATLPRWVPGLRFSLVAQEGPNELAAAQAGLLSLQAQRNQPRSSQPEAGPLTRLAPRTGRPAVLQMRKSGESEWVDDQMLAQAHHRQRAEAHDSLTRRFSSELKLWPRNLDATEGDFPYLDNGHRELVMLHADGNGLGLVLQALSRHCQGRPDDYVAAYGAFSSAVSQATREAVATATREVLAPAAADGMVPARPLVLGGDDLTMVLRPDLAVAFSRAFLLAFEVCTERALAEPRRRFNFLPKRLTAAAGLAMVHSSHPFHRAVDLANELCRHVKQATKRAAAAADGASPSALMFYRQTVSLLGDWTDILHAESAEHPAGPYPRLRTVHGPYLVAEQPKGGQQFSTVDQLQALAGLMRPGGLPRGAFRQIIGQMHSDVSAAQKSWQRIWEMLDRRGLKDQAHQLESALQALGVRQPRVGLPVIAEGTANHSRGGAEAWAVTPLADALTLSHMMAPDRGDDTEALP